MGSISLADLAALCDLQGHGQLPYPFARCVQLPANDLLVLALSL
ncbi:hypothetical protein [Mycobacterium camsae]|nr:hypothetical protein [Mycobacterium gordonae]